MFEIRVESEEFSWKITKTNVSLEHENQLTIELMEEDGNGYEEYVELNLNEKDKFKDIIKNVKDKIEEQIMNNVSLSLSEFYNLINPLFLNVDWPLEVD